MNITWNADNYTKNFSFVHQYGEDVLTLLNVPEGSFVVDLGCGNGALSERLAEKGYKVLGVDGSKDMLEVARKCAPHIPFMQADATEFELEEKADAIFSNAVFHWIDGDKQEKLIQNIAGQLKPGGQLVCEFGGKGCAESVHAALEKAFEKRGLSYLRTFYFPSIGEYTPLLEKYGFRVEYATLFDRPTVQRTQNGLIDWINMFVTKPFEGMDRAMKQEILAEVEEELKSKLYIDDKWVIDYVRIRLKAVKM